MKKYLMTSYLLLLFIAFQALLSAGWNPPVNVSAIGDAFQFDGPVLDVNAINNGIAVWTDLDVETNIKASFYKFGLGWEPPAIINPSPLNPNGSRVYLTQGDPSVTMNDSNYIVTAWEGAEWDFNLQTYIEVILAVTRSPDGVWSPIQRVSSYDPLNRDFQLDPENPFLDVNNTGLTLAVWTESRTSGRHIMANFLPPAGTWGTPTVIATPSGGFREDTPRCAINSKNNAVAVWKAIRPIFGNEIGASTYNAGTGLWTTVTLDPFANSVTLPRTGIDEAGNAIAIWVREIGSIPPIVYETVASYFDFSKGEWGPVTTLATGTDDTYIRYADVVMDRFGNATAVWNQQFNGNLEVYSSRLPLGGTWSAPELISTDGINTYLDDGLAQKLISVDLDGNVIVIIEQNDWNLQSIARFTVGGWQPPENIFNPEGEIRSNIGYGSCGFAISLWYEFFNKTVVAADNFGIFPPPANLKVSRCCDKFAFQKKCVNTLKWSPKPVCIDFYRIYRNGVLIGTVPGNQSSFTDSSCRKNRNVTYQVIAVNIYGSESSPATVMSGLK